MKAIRVQNFGEPEVMRLEEISVPEPKEGEVLVHLKAVGVNPVDTYLRSGQYNPDLRLPWTPGFDGAGVIAAVGPKVHHRKRGQRVYVSRSLTGTYAQEVLCREFQTHPLPEGVSFEQGAAIGVPYGAAYRALFQRACARPGETVLVHGASGGVGIAAVQLARAAGLRVIGTAGSQEGEALVRGQGAHEVLNHRVEGYLNRLPKLTCGEGVDVVLEMLANVNLEGDLQAVGDQGRIVIIGSRGRIEIDPRDAMKKEAAIFGMLLFNADTDEERAMHAAFYAGLDNGSLKPVISRELPLAKAAEAHHAVMEKSTLGKIVLVP